MLENIYVSCNCNQTPTAVDWGKNNLVCYASCNAVYIYNPEIGSGGRVTQNLVGHTKRVNSVKWLSYQNESETELVSGSTDFNIIAWSLKNNKYVPQILKGHESNVNIVDGLYKSKNQQNAVLVSASMDSTLRVWYRKNITDEFILSETINLGYNICVGLRISSLLTDTLLLASALDNSHIQLFVENEQTNEHQIKFQFSSSLKGHEDWVRGLDFTKYGDDVLLASSSQDAYIRLWRISENTDIENQEKKLIQDIFQKVVIQTAKTQYRVNLESVLMGHEGWVYSVSWNSENQLLSASLDKTMVIWEFDSENKFWLEKIRVGEVGGNTLGFYGGVFGPSGDKILAHSYHGAFHIWKNDSDRWNPQVTIGGHFNQVEDLSWEPNGSFLLSVSADQTTRIHAPWSSDKDLVTWHEIARPQVHGYDMSSIAIISRYKFASSSEEKVIRTFQAPKNFIDNFRQISNIKTDAEGDLLLQEEADGPKGASVPSLGLSNKAVYSNDNAEQSTMKNSKDMFVEESHFTAVDLFEPPTEETLMQNTLWPEIQKMYGHGYEVYCLAASSDGKYLASACKSTNLEHAAVLIWDTLTWKQLQKLTSHSLTVAQISFSPDSRHIVTVSRDRRWSLFSKNDESQFVLEASTDKKLAVHKRIIWCCSWSYNSKFFATGSRDGKVAVWTRNEKKNVDGCLGKYELASKHLDIPNESVTAIDFAPLSVDDGYLLAVGLDSGLIWIYKWTRENWIKILELNQSIAHHLTVKRIKFRPVVGRAGYQNNENILQMASCSSDCSVKIFDIFLDKI